MPTTNTIGMSIPMTNVQGGGTAFNQQNQVATGGIGMNYPNQMHTMGTAIQQYNNVPRQPTMIPGRFVNNPNEIVPQEVPMDGSVALFPVADGSRIYMKGWDNNGGIQTRSYVLEGAGEQPSDPLSLVMQRLDNIESMLKKQKPGYHGKPNRKPQGHRQESASKEE